MSWEYDTPFADVLGVFRASDACEDGLEYVEQFSERRFGVTIRMFALHNHPDSAQWAAWTIRLLEPEDVRIRDLLMELVVRDPITSFLLLREYGEQMRPIERTHLEQTRPGLAAALSAVDRPMYAYALQRDHPLSEDERSACRAAYGGKLPNVAT